MANTRLAQLRMRQWPFCIGVGTHENRANPIRPLLFWQEDTRCGVKEFMRSKKLHAAVRRLSESSAIERADRGCSRRAGCVGCTYPRRRMKRRLKTDSSDSRPL